MKESFETIYDLYSQEYNAVKYVDFRQTISTVQQKDCTESDFEAEDKSEFEEKSK